MGVMRCSRVGCESIMCDTYVPSVGYVCPYCQEEFKDYIATSDVTLDTQSSIEAYLADFMQTEKTERFPHRKMSVDDFFDKHTY